MGPPSSFETRRCATLLRMRAEVDLRIAPPSRPTAGDVSSDSLVKQPRHLLFTVTLRCPRAARASKGDGHHKSAMPTCAFINADLRVNPRSVADMVRGSRLRRSHLTMTDYFYSIAPPPRCRDAGAHLRVLFSVSR